jgi:hypothetical protein
MHKHGFVILFSCLILLAGCTESNSSQESSSVQSIAPSSSQAFCYLPNQSRTIQIQDFFKTCLRPGMTHLDVSNVMGNKGDKISTSSHNSIYRWKWPGGKLLTVHFDNDKLVSKSVSNS